MKLFLQAIFKFLLGVVLVATLLLLPAGTFSFFNGWLLMAMLFVPMVKVPEDQRVVIQDAHEAIISQELFGEVAALRSGIGCTANTRRFNLFRGKLFCECCGHPLAISKRELLSGPTDIYLCMHHYSHPDVCPQTHRIYHDMLYPYVLQQVRSFATSMKRRKVNSHLSNYADIEELTPEILDEIIERIEISHVTKKSKPGSVVHIYWKL